MIRKNFPGRVYERRLVALENLRNRWASRGAPGWALSEIIVLEERTSLDPYMVRTKKRRAL